MKQVTLGRTGITVPQNGFGMLPLQRISVEAACALLRRAYDVESRRLAEGDNLARLARHTTQTSRRGAGSDEGVWID